VQAKKNVKLVNNIPATLPYALGDTGRIIQIFYNLLGNSCKFTHKGSISVSAIAADSTISVHVTDTGIGIPESKFSSVFNEFEQVDMSTTRKCTYAAAAAAAAVMLMRATLCLLTVRCHFCRWRHRPWPQSGATARACTWRQHVPLVRAWQWHHVHLYASSKL
jgi:hypothetical protein